MLEAPGGVGRVQLGDQAIATMLRAGPAGPAKLAVRPEAIALLPAGAADGLPGTVRHAAFLGQTREYEVETASGMLFVVSPASAEPFAVGDAVACRLARVIPLRDPR